MISINIIALYYVAFIISRDFKMFFAARQFFFSPYDTSTFENLAAVRVIKIKKDALIDDEDKKNV